jgi:ATP-binding cassette subfamily B protein
MGVFTESNNTAGEQRRVEWSTVRRTLRVAAPHSALLLVFLVIVTVSSSIAIAYPLIYRAIIDDGILKQNIARIVRLATLIAGLGIIDAALSLCQTYLATRVGARVLVSLQTKLFDHIQGLPLAFFSRAQTGALVTRLISDVAGARSAFTDVLSNLAGNSVTVFLTFCALFALSWRLTLIILVLLPIFVLPAGYWGRQIRDITRESLAATAAMASSMVERFNVAGALLSKLFGRPAEDVSRFELKAQALAGTGIRAALYGRMNATGFTLTAMLGTALIYGWGGILATHHLLDLGTVVATSALLNRLYAPLMALSNVPVSVMTVLVSFERIFEILDLQSTILESSTPLAIPRGPIRLTFDHVSFHYPSAADASPTSLHPISICEKRTQQIVLHDISLTVEPGQLVALVGASGSGKTTITHLIPRLYDPQTGSVRLNGVDVRDAALACLRARIGVVTQDAHLFHDTLRANLKYARPDASDDEIRSALSDAQILGVVDALPDGLDTMVGERGYRFSGGEKQRLAIARLLLKAPDLVILDEATAHLDSTSETAIQRALERALAGRTSIVIAHRLSTIVRADQILVLQEGRIVERGTHGQLLSKTGVFAKLYQREFAETSLGFAAARN